MKLNEKGLKNKDTWTIKGYRVPKYDRETIRINTIKNPFWIHFGVGNIFRAFQANTVQNLLNKNIINRGLIAVEGYDYEIIEKINKPYDDYSILVTLKSNGTVEKTVIGSVVESLVADSGNKFHFDRLKEIFMNDSLQIASFTITEKGYSLIDAKSQFLKDVEADLEQGVSLPKSYIGKVTALIYERFLSGEKPIALVSMDNCSHNGDKLYEAINTIASAWEERGLVKKGFRDYINNPSKLSFPWTMIDKITPRPDDSVRKVLEEDGIEDIQQIITSKNTYVAPFVNGEECEYLVIEDAFPNGRPPLEKGGIIFTDRQTVDKVEKMKVSTCLNPLHTALAIFGCLLGYDLISKEMENPLLRKMVEIIGYKEGLLVAVDPKIINPKKFIDEVLQVRIPNPFMPDTPQRIATDTSQKLPIRFGETIKAYEQSNKLDTQDLKIIPLVFAGWIRYLMGVDDKGEPFIISPDPMLDALSLHIEDISLGDRIDAHKVLEPILSNEKIFGVNLYKVGLGKRVEDYFTEMIAGTGAVETTLNKYIKI
ncbi:MAG: mannitol dehydrogenase family protein [Epulopiscium sp.]|nr:mannitol dehydrogenase family protein [Candidatus Epulonipiscium sp.]